MAHQPRWTMSQVTELFNKPLIDLLFEAQQIHRQHFDPRQVQVSTLLSIKTGACPEDCKYCPQSARYKTGLEAERLMEVEQVLESARQAKNAGSTRFCMGAAWKNPNDRDMPYLEQMVKGVKALGLESCMTLGTLTDSQAQRLAEAGLDYYNHNLDTSPEFYGNIITTRTYQERLDTLDKVRDAGIKVCSGGIVGLGESVKDRAGLLLQLANLPTPPESVPINMLVKVKGTPLADNLPVTHGAGRWLEREGERWLNFSSNDYLGLSQHPAIIAAWQQGATRYGVGAGGSGHVSGYSEAHRALEEALADWLGYPRALLFISGFAANQALIAALVEKDDRIVADRLSHASLLEAASLSPAQLRRFTHNDPQQLAQLLAKPLAGEQLAVTEGIFSMDGDSAPLAAIHAATQAAGAVLLVDDAHGVGVVGDEGRGSCAAQAVRPELLVVTFGKAFGVSGAAVLCDEAMADYLLQFARHLIYSTAMPPAQAVALSAALGIIRSDEGQQRRDILAARIRQFREGMGEVSLGLTDSVSAIQPLIVGDNARALNLACRLRDAGCWATAIRPPTVPVGSARLRLTLTAAHHTEDINRLLEVLHGHSE